MVDRFAESNNILIQTLKIMQKQKQKQKQRNKVQTTG